MAKYSQEFSVGKMCVVFGLAPQAYYQWRRREARRRPQVQVFTYDALSRLKGDYAGAASPEQYVYNATTGSLSSKAGVSRRCCIGT